MRIDYRIRLDEAVSLADIFEVVKTLVEESMNKRRGGLMLGMATANAAPATILLTGVAGLAAGALSMAAGEYVSVSSQADAEQADARIEARALREHPERPRINGDALLRVRRGAPRPRCWSGIRWAAGREG